MGAAPKSSILIRTLMTIDYGNPQLVAATGRLPSASEGMNFVLTKPASQ